MDTPPTRSSENLGNLWQGSSRPLRLQRQLSLPKEHGCPGPRMAQPSALCFPPSRSATTGTQTSQGATAQADSNSPPLEEPTVGVGVISFQLLKAAPRRGYAFTLSFCRCFYPKRLTIGEYIKRLILKRQTDRGSAPNTKS